jgi:hypothetical protein
MRVYNLCDESHRWACFQNVSAGSGAWYSDVLPTKKDSAFLMQVSGFYTPEAPRSLWVQIYNYRSGRTRSNSILIEVVHSDMLHESHVKICCMPDCTFGGRETASGFQLWTMKCDTLATCIVSEPTENMWMCNLGQLIDTNLVL